MGLFELKTKLIQAQLRRERKQQEMKLKKLRLIAKKEMTLEKFRKEQRSIHKISVAGLTPAEKKILLKRKQLAEKRARIRNKNFNEGMVKIGGFVDKLIRDNDLGKTPTRKRRTTTKRKVVKRKAKSKRKK